MIRENIYYLLLVVLIVGGLVFYYFEESLIMAFALSLAFVVAFFKEQFFTVLKSFGIK